MTADCCDGDAAANALMRVTPRHTVLVWDDWYTCRTEMEAARTGIDIRALYTQQAEQNGAGSGESSMHPDCRIRWLFNDDISKIKIHLQIRIRGGHVGHEILVT